MPKIALIDGDIVAYRNASATCRNWYYVRGLEFKYKKEAVAYCDEHGIYDHDPTKNPKKISEKRRRTYPEIEVQQVIEGDGITRYNVDQMMLRILEDTGVEDYEVWLTGEGNYRHEIATIQEYKGNRDRDKVPPNLQLVRDYLVSDYAANTVDGIEADDMLGINQTAGGDSTVICSVDKDLRMIKGWHYNIAGREMDYVDQDEADYNFYKQLLTGDRTDNIRGVDGIGDKTADKILARLRTNAERYATILDKYNQVYGTEGAAALLENAQLLWIQRAEGVMWTPPNDAA